MEYKKQKNTNPAKDHFMDISIWVKNPNLFYPKNVFRELNKFINSIIIIKVINIQHIWNDY